MAIKLCVTIVYFFASFCCLTAAKFIQADNEEDNYTGRIFKIGNGRGDDKIQQLSLLQQGFDDFYLKHNQSSEIEQILEEFDKMNQKQKQDKLFKWFEVQNEQIPYLQDLEIILQKLRISTWVVYFVFICLIVFLLKKTEIQKNINVFQNEKSEHDRQDDQVDDQYHTTQLLINQSEKYENCTQQEKSKYQNIFKQMRHTQCVICKKSKSNSQLSCGHIFHFQCINKWMKKYKNCPICQSQNEHILPYHNIRKLRSNKMI